MPIDTGRVNEADPWGGAWNARYATGEQLVTAVAAKDHVAKSGNESIKVTWLLAPVEGEQRKVDEYYPYAGQRLGELLGALAPEWGPNEHHATGELAGRRCVAVVEEEEEENSWKEMVTRPRVRHLRVLPRTGAVRPAAAPQTFVQPSSDEEFQI